MEGRDSWVFGMDRDTLLYLKMENLGGPTLEQRNSAQAYVAAWMGGKSRGVIITYILCLSLFAVHLKLTTLLIGYTGIPKKNFWGERTLSKSLSDLSSIVLLSAFSFTLSTKMSQHKSHQDGSSLLSAPGDSFSQNCM